MSQSANNKLCIVMPTYNRAEFVDRSLETHIAIAKKNGIKIFISDNCSPDSTSEVVRKWQAVYPFLYYSRNECNLGADRNFEVALKLADTEYVWLLGDSYEIPEGGIEHILDLVQYRDYAALITNLYKNICLPAKVYSGESDLLGDLGGIMSCLSCLIYSKSLISSAEFSRYRGSFFIQTGIIFEYIQRKDFEIYWAQSISVTGLANSGLEKKGWARSRNVFDIGVGSWNKFVLSLPSSYSMDSKRKACVAFGVVSGAFTIKGMMLLRAQGLLDHEVYKAHKVGFGLSLTYPVVVVKILALLPRSVLNCMIYLARFFAGRTRMR